MAGIDELLATFMGQADTALNAGPAPWQQELLETVNPEKVKRQNIARALAKASTAMATTPGNFLAGVSAAAATGADSYLTDRQRAEDDRMKAMQLVQMSQQKDQDRRLNLLMDAIGVQRDSEKHKVGLDRDRAYTDYYKRRGAGANGTLSPAQVQTNKRAVRSELRAERRALERQVNDGTITPEQMDQRMQDLQFELEEYYGVTADESGEAASPQVVAPGKTDVQKNSVATPAPAETSGILTAPPPAEQRIRGKVYQTPKGPMTWTGNGWMPAQ
jgi:hypothetical protein